MLATAIRGLGLCVLVALTSSLTRAQEKDKELVYEGKTVAKWIDTVQNDKSARQRALAVEALGKIWILDSKSEAMGHVAIALRTDPSPAVRAQAAMVLSGLRKTDMEKYGAKPLVEVLKGEKESRVRKEIIAGIVKYPALCVLGVEGLTLSLKDSESGVKIAAAEALAIAGDQAKTAAGELVPLLMDKEKSVRIAGVYTLGRISPDGATTVAETMAKMLGTETEADIRRELIASITLLAEKTEPIIRALSAVLTDKEDELRRNAARALGLFGTASAPVAEELYKVFTSDKSKDVRIDALRAFGSAIGKEGVKSRLKDLRPQLDPSKQPDFEVRVALVDEIASLGYELIGQHVTVPKKDQKLTPQQEEANETIAALRLRTADPQIRVREAATIAMRNIQKKPEPKKDPEKKDPS